MSTDLYRRGDLIEIDFTTNDPVTGAAITASGGIAKLFAVGGGNTPITAGVTLTLNSRGAASGRHTIGVDSKNAAILPRTRYKAYVDGLTVGSTTAVQVLAGEIAIDTDTVSAGALTASTATGGTLPTGQRADVRSGDVIEVLDATTFAFVDLVRIATIAAGVFTVDTASGNWNSTPGATAPYRVYRGEQAKPLTPADAPLLATAAAQTTAQADLNTLKNYTDTIETVLATLATSAALATAQTSLNTIDARIDTEIPTILSSLTTIDGRLDTEIPQIISTQAAHTTWLAQIYAAIDTEVAAILAAAVPGIGAIKGVTDLLGTMLEASGGQQRFKGFSLSQAPTGSGGSTADQIAAAVLDLPDGVEAGITLRQAMRAQAAMLVGLLTGVGAPGASGTAVLRAIGALSNGQIRVTMLYDAVGNRTGVTLSLT